MALEVMYEGSAIPGIKNVNATDLQTSTIEPGKVCVLKTSNCTLPKVGEVFFGTGSLVNTTDAPFGLCADFKQDVIASGKVSVYNTPGMYKTDQVNGSPAKGDILSFDGNGKLQTAAASSNKFIVGICTEAKDSSGMIEFFLNIGALA